MTNSFIISTDLDGTLLDHHDYSFDAALTAIEVCKERDIPVILNTSKTLSEALSLQKQLELNSPVIVENGSAIVLPNSRKVVFGADRSEIIKFIDNTRRSYSWEFIGFNDWTVAEIAEQTGLSIDAAELASNKDYSEPFLWNDSEDAFQDFTKRATQNGLSVLKGGRFYHLQGQTDKAKPLVWLMQNHNEALSQLCEKPRLVALGDNKNDIAMLNVADIAVCVRSPVCDFPLIENKGTVIKTEACGPVGWNQAVLQILGVRD